MKHKYLKKEDFYSNLNMEGITAANKMHAKGVCKDSEIKKLTHIMTCASKVINFCLGDIFEAFRNIYIKVYKCDSAHFVSAPGVACQTVTKIQKYN